MKYRLIITSLIFVFGVLGIAELGVANYDKAQQALRRRNYSAAASAFFQSYAYPKNVSEKLKSEWGLGQSLQKLGLYYSASKYYSVIVRRGPGSKNPFFRNALEELGNINSTISLGQSHIVQLFKARIDPASVPGPARGFFFHYSGIEAYNRRNYNEALRHFKRVPTGNSYYAKALFHIGVINTLRGNRSQAISFFERVRNFASRDGNSWLQQQAILNIARIHYEAKRYREALTYYAQIPRESEHWLDAIFESSWTFFLIHKHNNVLGNIHTIQSPFFSDRFFPESYILRSITFLRLCRIDKSRQTLKEFKKRYAPVFADVKGILRRYKDDPRGFFRLVYEYRRGTLSKHRRAWSILDALSRTDPYREAGTTVRFSDRELSRIDSRWSSVGLADELRSFLSKKKAAAVSDAGGRLYRQARFFYNYLRELSSQSLLIDAELQLKKVDILRAKLNVGTVDKKGEFIGGLQPLQVGQDVEYWPFEGEYWEDELGGYVYNIASRCSKEK